MEFLMASELPLSSASLSALFDVERRARAADSLAGLRFVAVNETRSVVDYRHAAILEPDLRGLHVSAISDVPAVDRSTPYVQWLERVAQSLPVDHHGSVPVVPDNLSDWDRDAWSDLSPPTAILVPLAPPDGDAVGWLWVAREAAFSQNERYLFEHLGEVYGHALGAFNPKRKRGDARRWLKRRSLWFSVLLLIALVLSLPVKLTALAPAEVVALNPTVVAAPMQGVVKSVLVEPNARVEAGQPLVRFEDLEARNRFEVAREALEVAQARYRRAQQESFDSAESRAALATLEAEAMLRRTELQFAERRLEKVVIKAEHSGIAVFDDRSKWAGKPVQTGERVMLLADPTSFELSVTLPVSDAVVLEPGAPLKLFLDAHPLEPVPGEVLRAAYQPVVSEQGELVYRVTAKLTEERPYLRVGLSGTARLDGPRVSLAFYLFRRPITALRQMVGI